jgi:sugar lactone lactonase YvrE
MGRARRGSLHALVLSLLVLSTALPSLAATDTVTSLADDSSPGTLRSAIAAAAAGDTIVFGVTGTITLTQGYLQINQSLTISGPGAASLAISGNNTSGVFVITAGTASLSGLTIEHGNQAGAGGGIFSAAALTVSNCTFLNNTTTSALAAGGAIQSLGLGGLTVNNSTFSGNSVPAGYGGAIASYTGLTVGNSTFSGNSAGVNGGAIWNIGTATVSYSTFSGNSASSGGGVYEYESGTLTLKSTLLAAQTGGGNCYVAAGTTMTSAGYNLSDDASCTSFTQPGDQNNVTGAASNLGTLANNGGPTQTIALSSASSAVNAIPVNECTDAFGNLVLTDQRGITRPQGAGCDIGAYELAQPAPAANVCFGQHTPAPCSNTFTLDYYVPSGTTLGANPVQVVTQGTTGLDFTLAGTTCGSSLSGPATCTVQVGFAPRAPGLRMGAVNLINSSASPLATTPISGTGTGSALAFTPGIVTTAAGNGTKGYSGDNGLAASAQLDQPGGVAVDSAGNLYIADTYNQVIRKVNPAGTITTVAGNGTKSYSDGPATSAEFDQPLGLAVDGAGNLYIADYNNSVVRKLNAASGIVTTVAGAAGNLGYSGDGGPATSALLESPWSVAVDGVGNLYIADTGNQVIRKVNPAGIITTVAGNGTAGYSGDNGPATSAQLHQPQGVALDSAGNLYIADIYNQAIRKVNPAGIITTVAGNGTTGYSGDNGPATSAQLDGPEGVAVDSADNLYIVEFNSAVVRKVNALGIITTVAGTPLVAGYSGDNGPATSAQLQYPISLALDGAGSLYIADFLNNRIRKVSVTSSLLSFSSLNVDQTSSPRSVVVSDVGNGPLNFSPFTISSNFKLATVSDGCAAGTPLASGYDCNLGAEFAPLAPGNPLTGSITVADDAFTTPQSVSLNGIAIGPTQYLLTTAVNPSVGGTVTPPSGNQTANAVVNLKATPNAGYVFSGWTGSAVANAGSATTTITMTGPESVAANFVSALTVAPSSIDFGTVYLATLTTKDITLTNNGTTPITITDPLLSIVQGGNSFEFVAVNQCPKSLAAGSHCTISITFVAGPFYTPQTATLSIADNAPGNPQKVTLTATVIDPQASFNPGSLAFGNQTVNTSATKTVTLKNTGATALSLTGMTVTGTNAPEFTLTPSSNCGSSVASGGSCTISVTFKPVAKVSYSATVKVTDNTQSGTQTVPLSGAGH